MRSVVVSTVLLAAACGSQPKPAVVRIGQDLDRTGSIATASWRHAIGLAVTTMNEASKQAGHGYLSFEAVEGNSGNLPEQARASAIELVTKQAVKALITDSSQDDIAVNMLAYDGKPADALSVPIVCIACTSPEIDDPAATDSDPVEQAALRNEKRWNFRTTLSDSYQARIISRVLLGRGDHGDVNGDGKLKLGIYASDESYGHGFSNALKALVEKEHPGAIVEQVFHGMPVQPVRYDFAGDVKKLVGGGGSGYVAPDAVVEISFAKYLAGFMRAWQASGTKVLLFHTHGVRVESLIYQLGAGLEGAEGTSQALLGDGPSAAAFSEDMIAATTRPPGFRDAAAYDAAMTLMLATVQAARAADVTDPNGLSGAQIRDAMWRINDPHGQPVTAGVAGIAHALKLLWAGKAIDYRGASGPCDFDEWGDVRTRLARFHVQGGKFVDQEKYDCSVSADCPPLLPHAER